MNDELIPFFTYRDLYLKSLNRVDITVNLPKLRQLGQSVSNWEIRERLKKMLNAIEMSDFKVLDSNLEKVEFAAVINSSADAKYVIKALDGISFRAVGFTEPLTVTVIKGNLDFPTRVDWDQYFAECKNMNEKNAGERPDTIYIGGLPFDWFKSPISDSYEETFKQIFSEFGEVEAIDIPQCDPIRKQMDDDISGIRLSSWSFGQDLFFEVYIQFKEYIGFCNAMTALSGKILVQKTPGTLREAKIKVDFDKTAHLSYRKITQRSVRRAYIEYNNELKHIRSGDKPESSTKKVEENQAKGDELARQLMRAEKRRKFEMQRNYEQRLRERLKSKLSERLQSVQKERETGAKALLKYVAGLYRAQVQALKHSSMELNELASEYVKENDLPEEEILREQLLRRQEMKLRSRIAERMLTNKPGNGH